MDALAKWLETQEGPHRVDRLAEASGVSRRTIFRYLAGAGGMTPETARRIQTATGGAVSAAELLGIDPPSSDEPPHAA